MIVLHVKDINMARKEKTCYECGRVIDSNISGTGSFDDKKLKNNKILIKIDPFEDKEADERLSRRADKSGYAKNNTEPSSSKPAGKKKDPEMHAPKKKKVKKRY